jgi:hypothetical protein
MSDATSNKLSTVTLNLFQGPFYLSSPERAARWMLKQVQHDEVGGVK